MIISKQQARKLLEGKHLKLRQVKNGVEMSPRVDKNGKHYFTSAQIKKILEIRKLEKFQVEKNGRGFFSNLYNKVKAFGSNVLETIKTHIQPNLLAAFEKTSNLIRSAKPGSRKLQYGELHPTGLQNGQVVDYRFLGPGTQFEKERYWAPVNALDALAKKHDEEYYNARNLIGPAKASMIQKADDDFIRELTIHADKYRNLPFYELAKRGIESKGGVEKILSLIKGEPRILFGG